MKPFKAMVLVSLLGCQPATAQSQNCLPRSVAVERLASKYGEAPVGRGLAVAGARMVELFVSEQGSWTLLVTTAVGQSCMIATGTDWQEIARTAKGDPL